MSQLTADLEDIATIIRGLASTQPARRSSCTYFTYNSEPNCIVGAAVVEFTNQGGDPRYLEAIRMNNAMSFHPLVVKNFGSELYLEGMRRLEWIARVQRHQDGVYDWSEAVKEADCQILSYV